MSLAGDPALVHPTPPRQFLDDRNQTLVLKVQRKNGANVGVFGRVDSELRTVRIDIVAKYRPATRPLPLATRGGNLVPRALRDDLTLELRERQQDIQDQASIDVAVLNCWVTDTKETWYSSNAPIILAKSSRSGSGGRLYRPRPPGPCQPGCQPGAGPGRAGPCCRRCSHVVVAVGQTDHPSCRWLAI